MIQRYDVFITDHWWEADPRDNGEFVKYADLSAWIACTERMPEMHVIEPGYTESADVLIFFPGENPEVWVAKLLKLGDDDMHWEADDSYFTLGGPTHWMPLPSAPEPPK